MRPIRFDRAPAQMASVAGLLAVLMLCGCTAPQPSFRQVQVCFTGENDGPALREMLRQAASDEHMAFSDISGQTFDQLVNAKAPIPNKNRAEFVQVFVEGADGMGLGAGNTGLGDNQAALGFTAGKDQKAARVFADRIIARLQTKWTVHEISADGGAKPLACTSGR